MLRGQVGSRRGTLDSGVDRLAIRGQRIDGQAEQLSHGRDGKGKGLLVERSRVISRLCETVQNESHVISSHVVSCRVEGEWLPRSEGPARSRRCGVST